MPPRTPKRQQATSRPIRSRKPDFTSKHVQDRQPEPLHAPRPLRLATPPVSGKGPGTPLFRPLTPEMAAFLTGLPTLLNQIMPLSGAHRRTLPDAVHELSGLLTSERGGLDMPYWSAPRLTSAYIRYFLPWNLVRLGCFLPGLSLPQPTEGALIVDLGSGPLTLPLALWLSFPAWRDVPLDILATDSSGQPLDIGRKLFQLVAPESPWRIRTLRAPLHKALRDLRGEPLLITAGNVLNELADKRDRRDESTQAERMAELASRFASLLHPDGALLCIEPGNRLGGTVLEQLRAGAMEEGLTPVSPCPHPNDCPLLDRRGPGSGWCHAALDSGQAPDWLLALSKDAGLGKTGLSLSHMLLRPKGAPPEHAPAKEGTETARILSDAFAVPGLGLARYACTGKGLALIAASAAIAQGTLIAVRPSRPPQTDPKSGARVMTAAE